MDAYTVNVRIVKNMWNNHRSHSTMQKAIEDAQEYREAWIYANYGAEYHWKDGDWQEDAVGDTDGNIVPNP